ncbi:MAG: DUF4388 domain-containing protein [Chloroflexota bacterium]|nr:DUF4388 domain-containing protein [Chloroflexota bacterium]
MALKGNLRDFGIVQLLNLINLARKTGMLRVEQDTKSAQLAFREGKLIHATVNGAGSQLAEALRRSGVITEKQASAIQSRAGERSDRELGLLLVNAGYVSQGDISMSMRSYFLENIYPLFAWSEGSFRFESGAQTDDGVITVPIDLENVIVEGTRRLEQWERLQDELPDLDVSLKFADRPRANLRDINLNVEEWRVISFINPRNTIRQIADYNNMGDFQIRKIVYGLLQAGLVEIVRPESKKPEGLEAARRVAAKRRRPDVKRNVIMRLIDRIREL